MKNEFDKTVGVIYIILAIIMFVFWCFRFMPIVIEDIVDIASDRNETQCQVMTYEDFKNQLEDYEGHDKDNLKRQMGLIENETMISDSDSDSYTADASISNVLSCTACGQELKEEDNYCSNCGEKHNSSCNNCGKELKSEDAYCSACGTKQ